MMPASWAKRSRRPVLCAIGTLSGSSAGMRSRTRWPSSTSSIASSASGLISWRPSSCRKKCADVARGGGVALALDDRIAHPQLRREGRNSVQTEAREQCVGGVVAGGLDHAANRGAGAQSEDSLVEGEEPRLLLAVRFREHDQLVERGGDVCLVGVADARRPVREVLHDKRDAPVEARGLGLELLAHLSELRVLRRCGRCECGRCQQRGHDERGRDSVAPRPGGLLQAAVPTRGRASRGACALP